MIQDYQTNKVYLAEGLSHYVPVCRNLLEALHREQIHVEFIPYTSSYKQVWARDYMPTQLEKTLFFLYQYWPDYLLGYDGYIPNVLKIIKHLDLGRILTMTLSKDQPMVIIDNLHHGRISKELILDGGNFVKCGDKVIMTDKIFQENNWIERKELLSILENYLQIQIVIIPWDRYEIFGHSDGMVQWIEGNRVLMNNYVNTDPGFRKRLLEALTPHFVVEELEFNTPRLNKLSWAYLNFLRVKNYIFLPGLHAKEDPLALQQIQQFYPDCKVIQVQGCEELARDGGALHCISWNIETDEPARYSRDVPKNKI